MAKEAASASSEPTWGGWGVVHTASRTTACPSGDERRDLGMLGEPRAMTIPPRTPRAQRRTRNSRPSTSALPSKAANVPDWLGCGSEQRCIKLLRRCDKRTVVGTATAAGSQRQHGLELHRLPMANHQGFGLLLQGNHLLKDTDNKPAQWCRSRSWAALPLESVDLVRFKRAGAERWPSGTDRTQVVLHGNGSSGKTRTGPVVHGFCG